MIGNKFQDTSTMIKHIDESHEFWRKLIRGETQKEKINRDQTSMPRMCKTYTPSEEATDKFGIPAASDIKPAAPIPDKYKYWYYLDEDFKVITVPGEVIDVV